MNEIKVTEMTEATQINDNDLLMIVQNEKSKKVKLSTIKKTRIFNRRGKYRKHLNIWKTYL